MILAAILDDATLSAADQLGIRKWATLADKTGVGMKTAIKNFVDWGAMLTRRPSSMLKHVPPLMVPKASIGIWRGVIVRVHNGFQAVQV